MEIFHELYGRYYQNVTRILLETPCTREVMEKIIKEQGFEESLLFAAENYRQSRMEFAGKRRASMVFKAVV